METIDGPKDIRSVDEGTAEDSNAYIEDLRKRADEVAIVVDKFEQRLSEVEQFFSKKQSNTCETAFMLEDTNEEKIRQLRAACREEDARRRMQVLMRKFRIILRQITQHKWAGPFLKPVDAAGLGLTDYFQIIEKPMDFKTIENKMEAKDGTGYKNVREICSDVRQIFKNAMKYNDEGNDVHVMAKTLLAMFEAKWLKFLPIVDQEEKRCKKEDQKAQREMQKAREDFYARKAMDLSTELDEFDTHLKKLQEDVLQKCRRFTVQEKADLYSGLRELSEEDLREALRIVCQMNPSFEVSAEGVSLDLDFQSEATLWRLKAFVEGVLQTRDTKATTASSSNNNNNNNNKCKKRKRGIGDKSSKKRSKKLL